MSASVIEFRHLSKSYWEAAQEHVILDDVSGVVHAGEFVVLFGKSGCGKSTLLNLISGIDAPNRGDILVRGQSLAGMNETERTLFRRRHIGFIFQNFNLIPTLTVRDNLLLPLELTAQLDGDGRAKPAAMLAQLGLGRRLDTYPDRLSTGEQQRIAIARALIHSPDLILADEPTGNLDHDTGQQVLNLLERLVREANKTLFMVTHSREVIGLADRLLTIRDCRLEAG